MERRSDIRHRTVFCPAYVRAKSGIDYVLLRNVSHEGASFRGATRRVAGEEICYCVGDLGPIKAVVKWVNGAVFGVRNASSRIGNLSLATAYPYRSVRVPMTSAISLYMNGRRFAGFLKDISQSGACIETSVRLDPGQLISVAFGGLSVEAATVKWTSNGRIGLRFAKPLDLESIARALIRLQANAPASNLELT